VLGPAAAKTCDSLIDAYIAEPVSRDRLLERVETAMRLMTYDGIISELLSLTMQKQRLQNHSDTGPVEHGPDIASLSRRIDELHRHIDDELSDVESQYTASFGRKHRPPPQQQTESESA
jgi:hypothetical protein